MNSTTILEDCFEFLDPNDIRIKGHQCLHIGLRSQKVFKCGNCGLHSDADLNAANVISLMGSSVIRPERVILACRLDGLKANAKALNFSRG